MATAVEEALKAAPSSNAGRRRSAGTGGKNKTVSAGFRASLKTLVDKLNEAEFCTKRKCPENWRKTKQDETLMLLEIATESENTLLACIGH